MLKGEGCCASRVFGDFELQVHADLGFKALGFRADEGFGGFGLSVVGSWAEILPDQSCLGCRRDIAF